MAADGRIVIDVELNDGSVVQGTADISRQLDRMGDNSESVFKKVGNGFKTLAKAAAIGVGAVAGIGTAVVGLAKPLVEAAGAAQALNSQFEQVFEGLEDSATTALNKISAETSILPERLKGSFVQMAAFAKTTGMDTAKALSLTERATMAAADSAAFYDRSIEDVTESLQSFLKGNFENDAALGISATEFTRNAAAAELFGKKFKDLSEEQKQFTLLHMVEEGNKLSGAMGQASREGDGLENVVGNLQQAWEGLKVKLGEPILEPAIAALKWLTKVISEFDVAPFISAFQLLKSGVVNVFSEVKSSVEFAIVTIRDMWTTHGASIVDAAVKIFESVKATTLPIIQNAFETITGIFSNLKLAWERDGQAIVERLSNIFESLKTIVVPIAQNTVDLVVNYFGKIKEFWDKDGQQLLQAASNLFQGILSVVEFCMPAIKFVVEYVFNAVKNVISGTLDTVMGIAKIFSGLFTADWSKLWEGVKQTFSGAVDLILGIMSLTFVGGIRTALTNLAKTAINLVKNKWTSIVNLFKTQTANVGTTVSNMATSVLNFFKNLATNTTNTIRSMSSSVVTQLKTMGSNMLGAIKELPSKFLQFGKDIINGLVNGLKSKMAEATAAISNIADTIANTAKTVLGIHSPSRVFKEIGLWTGEGLVIGLDSSSKNVNKAMESIGNGILTVSKSFQKEYSDLLSEHNKKNENKQDATLKRIQNIRNSAAKKKKALTKAQLAEIASLEKSYLDQKSTNKSNFDKKYKALVEKSEKEYFDVIRNYVDDKKSLNELSLEDEAEIWEQSIEMFVVGSKQRIQAQQNYNKAIKALNKQRLDDIESSVANKKSLDQLSLIDEARIWEESIKLFEEGSDERIKAQQNHQKAVKAVNDEILSINKEYQSQMLKIDEDYIKEVERINKEYEDTFKARVSSLVSFATTFEEFKVELNRTGEELTANLQSQVDGFKKWQEEFEKLSGRGVDSDLLNELSDLGVKALPELVALNSMTDEQLTKYSELYREKSKLAREQATKELEGMKKDTDQKLLDLRTASDAQLAKLQSEWDLRIKNLVRATDSELSTLQQVGVDAGQGLLDGLASMESPLIDKATQIAEAIKATIQSALDIHSPSRWMRDFVAGNLAKGFDIGVNKHLSIFKNAASNIGDLIKPNIVNPLRGVKADLGTVATKSLSQINNNTQANRIDNSRSFKYYITAPGETASDYDRMMRRMQFEAGL